MRPLNGFTLVEPEPETTVTSSGIIIPETAAPGNVQYGIVIESSYDPDQISVGDRVFFSRLSGNSIVADEKTYLTLHGDDILGVVLPE